MQKANKQQNNKIQLPANCQINKDKINKIRKLGSTHTACLSYDYSTLTIHNCIQIDQQATSVIPLLHVWHLLRVQDIGGLQLVTVKGPTEGYS